MTDISRILVVGSGAMGSQIAMVCALSGYEVRVQDISDDSLARAEAQLRARIDRNVTKGRLTEADRDAAFGRMTFTTDLAAAAQDVDFVIEAAIEKLDVKRELFARLDELCPEHAILTSNSSSFIPSRIADATTRPDRVCNMHFFNPALVMKCVEVVRGEATSDDTIEATVELTRSLGKLPVLLDKEINGFVANRILTEIRREAMFLVDGGYASPEAVDTACRTALGHPMGPFELQDLTGLDIGYYSQLGRFEDSGDPVDKPAESLAERVEAGHLGRKTGRGWYVYDAEGNKTGVNRWN
ncbi:MAG TPA: 3-hydroxyacyl-CoA dehydrogenase family protein [Flexivirga sp.]|uniref:3-hydroxyacyl-CoA dehydrogenase family protein n=1 Tax=Flexivirga sp. TaxID=1962927 RepID=UPI002C7DA367|nr:3-hydroxyacyl-CoA dehydrogenase family protein [Flexivirga sp.]HWC22417.1 3-hydroxyacyl-CoA dehydrogenase family protein [Flexivirga sp.]